MSVADPEFDAKVIDLYQAGYSSRGIAMVLPVSDKGVLAILKRHNIPRRSSGGRKSYLPGDELKLTVSLYKDQGKSIFEVAKILGRSETAIRIRLQRAGVERRSRSMALKNHLSKLSKRGLSERSEKIFQARSPESRRRFHEGGRAQRRQRAA